MGFVEPYSGLIDWMELFWYKGLRVAARTTLPFNSNPCTLEFYMPVYMSEAQPIETFLKVLFVNEKLEI